MPIASEEAKLSWLQSKFDAHILNVCKLCSENNYAYVIIVAFVEQESMQRKFDSQLGSIKSFKNLSQTSKDEHNKLWAKHVSSEDAWCSILMNLDTWK
jgi:hypothetical protein